MQCLDGFGQGIDRFEDGKVIFPIGGDDLDLDEIEIEGEEVDDEEIDADEPAPEEEVPDETGSPLIRIRSRICSR